MVALGRGRDSQQEIGVRETREAVRKSHAAKQALIGRQVLCVHTTNDDTAFDAVPPRKPAHMILKLLRENPVARLVVLEVSGSRNVGDPEPGERYLRKPVDVRQTICQPLQTELL